MAEVVEVWADTGEVVERGFTPKELAQREIDIAAALEAKEAEWAREKARLAAIAHARSLGFTDEMIAAMGLGSEA